ncbi:MAG TPA: antibiotic biosynthesis monooxygenase family protein [Ohtaekwangia sp.]|uniref:antibiotic biosynthesis monooxygenase family protein n=1 Tax=Ohtaekwangia sp. TaxID=2066019 RepID=UPI002F92DBBC
MTQISKDNKCLTLINTFQVEPSKQQELIALLTEATNEVVRYIPGFISSALHRSLDGKLVTMYAQWESMELYQKMRENKQAADIFMKAASLADFQGGFYEVVEVFNATLKH